MPNAGKALFDAMVALAAARALVATAKLACAEEPSVMISALVGAIILVARDQNRAPTPDVLAMAITSLQEGHDIIVSRQRQREGVPS